MLMMGGIRVKETVWMRSTYYVMCSLSPYYQSHPWILDVQVGIIWWLLSGSIKLVVLSGGKVHVFSAFMLIAVCTLCVHFLLKYTSLLSGRKKSSLHDHRGIGILYALNSWRNSRHLDAFLVWIQHKGANSGHWKKQNKFLIREFHIGKHM